jgi:release factor glutamine methyltransferase
MSPREALARGADHLREAGIESSRLDARVLLAHILDVGPTELVSIEREPSAQAQARYDSYLRRRAAREPVAYILGRKEFWSLDFEVGPGALVPRPETETLIEEIEREFPDKKAALKILDLGTGSGCILITLLSLYPNAQGVGADKSPEALAWAQRNAFRHGVESRCDLRLADWAAMDETGFDIVVSNPPYLTSHELERLQPEVAYEPREALAGGEDGLAAYRSLAALLPRLLAPSACAVMEIGAGQAEGVSAVLRRAGLVIDHVTPDLSGIPRCIVARKAK